VNSIAYHRFEPALEIPLVRNRLVQVELLTYGSPRALSAYIDVRREVFRMRESFNTHTRHTQKDIDARAEADGRFLHAQ
jgi:hypothetical protein